jgi:predicted NBD/HSP70 family sugar kinase
VGLQLNPATGVLLSVDVAPTAWRVAAADFAGTIRATAAATADPAGPPEEVLVPVLRALERLVGELGGSNRDVRGIALALPCPVDHAAGRILRPPLMPGWDGFDVHAAFAKAYAAPLLLDNDVNLMALGEYRVRGRRDEHLLFANLGYGIGSGIVSRGALHRGGDGAAGDIGHLSLAGHDDVRCDCGKTGCVEAVASGRVIAAGLRAQDPRLGTLAAVLRAVAAGDERARAAVTLAADRLGEVLAGVISFYNPTTMILGGELAQLDAEVLSAVRDAVYRRALPLATRTVTIARSAAGDRAAVIGGAVMLHEHLLSPTGLRGLLMAQRRAPGTPVAGSALSAPRAHGRGR